MGAVLFEHNKAAYAAAAAMLQETGKAAVVHPTGTGKSFIGFKLCEDHPDRRVCWLSPSEYIFKTQLENYTAAGGDELENISFFTYAKLMLMSGAEVSEIKPDYIVLDEFHRCGAEMWGKGVQALLSVYPGASILGLSATSIRYLDNQRDMADELFDGNVASEMTLGEAIVRGVLQPPKYVLSVFAYQKDLDRFQRRANQAKSKAVREKAAKLLEALRRTLEQADGLDMVFQKHMTDRQGKYLAFCANAEHMDEMIARVPEWFGKIDPAPHVYRAYSEDPATSKVFTDFKADNSEHLRLLFCIDMLNEGIHVEDVAGVILFRPTVSPIIYKQQIGRALSAGKSREPVIFDVVNNIENLYSIGTIQQEMEQAAEYFRFHGQGERIVHDHFQILDEVRNCRQLFEELEDTLSASWELMYQYAEEYYRRNGHLNVPRRYKTPEGYSLGNWLSTQRKVRAGQQYGNLSVEQIVRLNAIGMVWENRLELAWERGYQAASTYYQGHGDLLAEKGYISQNGYPLGQWLTNQRTAKVLGKLTSDHEKRLDKIGMVWSKNDYQWKQNFQAAERYYREHGNLDVPAAYVEDGVTLGRWLSVQRRAKKEGRLSEGQVRRLEQLGIVWEDVYTRRWEYGYQQAKKWYAVHHDLEPPATYIDSDGFPLGKWLDRHRMIAPYTGRRAIQLTPERKAKLDALGMRWEKKPDPWEVRYDLARAFYEEHGHLRVPADYKPEGIWLNKWLSEQKQIMAGKRKGKSLTADQLRRLKAISFDDLNSKERAWEEQYAQAKAYFDRHGDLEVPAGFVAENGRRLDIWVFRQRKKYRDGKLSPERRRRLEAVGVARQEERDGTQMVPRKRAEIWQNGTV